MKNKCDCYNTKKEIIYSFNPITGEPIKHEFEIGVCFGTKEMDKCICNGDKMNCDFYPEVREKAKQNISIEDAISHFKYGISHDIFSEPVTSYAKMAVAALEKQNPKKIISDGNDEADWVHCPCCNEILGINEEAYTAFYDNDWNPIYCHKCGQAITWE